MTTIRSTCGFALAILLAARAASAQDAVPPPTAPPAAVSPDATFEVASIKPSNPDPANPLTVVPNFRPQPGGRLIINNFPLKLLVGFAYDMQDFRVDGGPPAS
jgi:hypothetical protein